MRNELSIRATGETMVKHAAAKTKLVMAPPRKRAPTAETAAIAAIPSGAKNPASSMPAAMPAAVPGGSQPAARKSVLRLVKVHTSDEPVAAVAQKTPAAPEPAPDTHPRAMDGMTIPGQILIVDDDAIFRSEFRECFDEFDIIEVPSGEAALALLRGPHEVELILLDVRMSGLSGIETLHQIRKIAPTVRIIVFTGYSSTSVAIEALRGQADDFLEKPLDLDDTRKLFKKYLGNRRGQPAINSLGAKDKIERIKEYLQRNARKKVTLVDAAKIIHLSPKHLCRLFKQQTGEGFSDYKLTLKIAEAKQLLAGSGYTVAQIATTLGYENPESLIRQFKHMVQLTPTEFRRKNQAAKK